METFAENGRTPPERIFPRGGGLMATRIRAYDWSKTPIGASESWPESLRTAVDLCLCSQFPAVILWGPELIQIYNDAYIPVLGPAKDSLALGLSARETWMETWPVMAAMLDSVLEKGEATKAEDLPLVINRHGFLEETYFTLSNSPIHAEDGAVKGIFVISTETTQRVISERRLRTLRDLASRTSEASSAGSACRLAADSLAGSSDVPLALIYLLDDRGKAADLCTSVGLGAGTPASPERVSFLPLERTIPHRQQPPQWPLRKVARTQKAELISAAAEPFEAWDPSLREKLPRTVLVLPICRTGDSSTAGVLVAGVNQRLVLDDSYKAFFDLVAGQIATALYNARAREDERRRAEALAEIDRAKTAFFSNISHEFRTPLTLMVGPLREALEGTGLGPEQRSALEMVLRNGLRLERLVDNLLDFAKIESGHVQGSFEPTDLPHFTSELASMFRSAIERAGLSINVNCPPMGEPVFVDREMWEKIVLNLMSNAVKFTFTGQIAISTSVVDDMFELSVRDTGVGIPAEDIPRLFDRFHRSRLTPSRTREGAGIGLALVRDLVWQHGGNVRVDSVPGSGSRFIVSVPLGFAHLPRERVRSAGAFAGERPRPHSHLAEALQAFPTKSRTEPAVTNDPDRERVLVIDDDPDMREYLSRILGRQWNVRSASDGRSALSAADEFQPDIVLADIMMPGLDGFQLLRLLRTRPGMETLPVMLISARAGEEAALEGFEAGADSYLVKPFSERELTGRVRAALELARLRRDTILQAQRQATENARLCEKVESARREAEESTRRFEDLVDSLDAIVWEADLNPFHFTFISRRAESLLGYPRERWTDKPGFPVELIHADDRRKLEDFCGDAALGDGPHPFECRALPAGGGPIWLRTTAYVKRDECGRAMRLRGLTMDITERKRAEEAIRRSNEDLQQFAYVASHDLQEPLRTIASYTQLLARRYRNKLDENADEYIAYITGGVQRMSELIQDLLIYSLAVDPRVGSIEPTDLEAILKWTIMNLHSAISETGATITHDRLPTVTVDQKRMMQVFQNLIGNALKYRASQVPEIHVSAARQGEYWMISVRDNGIGIDPVYQERIFGIFKRLHGPAYPGTGIGLAICQSVIERHGGRIWVNSEPGHGSIFYFTLPAC